MSIGEQTRPCPYCREIIIAGAIRCKHCHADLSDKPQAGNFSVVGAAYGVTVGGSGNRIEGGVHFSLSELASVDPATKKELTAAYEAKVRDFPEDAQYHFALGLSYLDQSLYRLSEAALRKALGKTTWEADVLYYLALALLEGRTPRNLRLSEVREIEGYLAAAVSQRRNCSHYQYFLAIVKHEYYVLNGLRVPPPSIEELISAAQAGALDSDELRSLLSHIPLPNSASFSTLNNLPHRV